MNVNFNVKEKVDSIYPEIVKIRRQLHENPELSQQEKETSALVCKVLDEHGIIYQSGIAGYGVVAQSVMVLELLELEQIWMPFQYAKTPGFLTHQR